MLRSDLEIEENKTLEELDQLKYSLELTKKSIAEQDKIKDEKFNRIEEFMKSIGNEISSLTSDLSNLKSAIITTNSANRIEFALIDSQIAAFNKEIVI